MGFHKPLKSDIYFNYRLGKARHLTELFTFYHQHLFLNYNVININVQINPCYDVTPSWAISRTLAHVKNKKLMKGKALRKHSLHEKTAASVLLKLFIGGNE